MVQRGPRSGFPKTMADLATRALAAVDWGGAWTAGVPSLPTMGFRASFACALLLMPLLVGEAVHSRRRMKE